jgi:hypothetical protein
MTATDFNTVNLRRALRDSLEIVIDEGHAVTLDLIAMTPPVAAAWLADYAYPRQRALYSSGARLYGEMMTRGEWRVSTLLLATYTGPATDELRPGPYLLNGYNRLGGVLASGLAVRFLVEHHHLADAAAVHDLYAVQDRGRSRSISDVLRSLGLPDELQIRIDALKTASEAEPLIAGNFEHRQKTQTDAFGRVAFIRDWLPEIRSWVEATAGTPHRLRPFVYPAPVTAVFLYILRHQPERAPAFIRAICHDDGLHVGTPEKTTLDWLQDNRVRTMQVASYARHVAAGWNAYYENRPLERLLVRDIAATRPRIAGTPLTGDQPSPDRPAAPDPFADRRRRHHRQEAAR